LLSPPPESSLLSPPPSPESSPLSPSPESSPLSPPPSPSPSSPLSPPPSPSPPSPPPSTSGIGIVTTDLQGGQGYDEGNYTDSFGGTSAAAPMVSGVVALMLEANPNLTWRDVQHILVETSRKNDDREDAGWTKNGAGYWVNHNYGFGAVDAGAAVRKARNWQSVGEEVPVGPHWQALPDDPNDDKIGQLIPDYNSEAALKKFFTEDELPAIRQFLNQEPSDTSKHPKDLLSPEQFSKLEQALAEPNPDYLESKINITDDINIEWVEVNFNATHEYRGDLKIVLVSPDDTESVLAERHADPGNDSDIYNWNFTSARHWGESSQGEWTLRVSDERGEEIGHWEGWSINFFGTKNPTGVSIEAVDNSATEGGGAGQLVVTRTEENIDQALEVSYALAGSATNGVDYVVGAKHSAGGSATTPNSGGNASPLQGTVTIPAGELRATIPIVANRDYESEAEETVIVNLLDGRGYAVDESLDSASVNLANDTILSSYGPFVYENPDNGHLYILSQPDTWHGAQAQAEVLGGNLVTVSNQAEQDWLQETFGRQNLWIGFTDSEIYDKTEGSFEWVSGEESTYTNWRPGEPNNLNNAEDFAATGNDDLWNDLDARDSGLVSKFAGIIEIDPASLEQPIVNIEVTDPSAGEDGNAGQLLIQRVGAMDADLTVNYSLAGDATNGADYAELTGTATIPAGESLLTIPIIALSDSLAEGDETLVVTLESGNYQIGTGGSGHVVLSDGVASPAPTIYTHPETGNQYFLTTPDTWLGAQEQAKAAGGNLVTINDIGEQKWLETTFDNAPDGLKVYDDKANFLGQTGATAISPFQNREDFSSLTLDGLTFSAVGSDSLSIKDRTPRLPGLDLTSNGTEQLNIDLPNPVNFFGFDFTEPEFDPGVNATFVDSKFEVTLLSGGTTVDSFEFEPPNDIASFVGFSSGETFDRVEIREIVGANENEFFGNFYTGVASLDTLHIGLTDSPIYGQGEGDYRWVAGEEVTYTNWFPGFPNNNLGGGPEGEDFTWISGGGKGSKWNDSHLAGINDPNWRPPRGIVEIPAEPAAAATFLNPGTPYLSSSDSPFNGQDFDYFYLEDFEDGALNTLGVSVSSGIAWNSPNHMDSVDADDGAIDGSGTNGRSWWPDSSEESVTFTFDENALGKLPTNAGVVWTDGPSGTVALEAFDAEGNSLGISSSTEVISNSSVGETTEDRFFGATYDKGISAIKLYRDVSGGWEIDHLQYGLATPTVNIEVTDPEASETGDGGYMVVTRSGDTSQEITVNYTLGGSATVGTDYENPGSSIVIPAGETQAVIAIKPINDTGAEGSENVTVTLGTGSGYVLGSDASGTVTTTDDEPSYNWTWTSFGEDIHTGGNSVRLLNTPETDNARNAFLSKLSSFEVEDFESFANNETPSTLTFGSTTANVPGTFEVLELPSGTIDGYHPISGDKFLRYHHQSEFKIEFDSPQSAFGFSAVDVGDAEGKIIVKLHREDGSTEDIFGPHALNGSRTGSISYFGVTDANEPFTGVTIVNPTKDPFGLDDFIIGELKPDLVASATPANDTFIQPYTEDQTQDLVDIVVSDPDGETKVSLKLSDPAAGSLQAGTVQSSATGVWEASGTVTEVNDLLAKLQFVPAANYNSDLTIALEVSDAASGGGSPLTGTINLQGIAVNDAPNLTEAANNVLFQHEGSTNPSSAGWQETTYAGNFAGPVTNDLGLGIDAWFTDDNVTGSGGSRSISYWGTPTASQVQEANNLGWKLSANVRLVEPTTNLGQAATALIYRDGTTSYQLHLGSDSDGNLQAALIDGLGANSSSTLVDLNGGLNDYHQYELVFDPVSDSVSLLVDGIEQFSDYDGASFSSSPSVFWGSGTSNGVAESNWNSVKFETFLAGAVENKPYTITYENLLALSDASDPEGDAISFQISDLASGTLTKDGAAVIPGTTTLAAGESLVWQPDSAGDAVSAFSISATDGSASSPAVPVNIDVAENPLTVANTNDSGPGSLRAALEWANSSPGKDTISFNIPTTDSGYNSSTEAFTIRPQSELPTITDSIVIDGSSQTGFASSPLIELSGTNAGATANGLTISAGNSTVRGLAINSFGQHGILLSGSGGNLLEGNYIGTDVTGTQDLGNSNTGLFVSGSANNIIGGAAAGAGNLISGNTFYGVRIIGSESQNNQILGNKIGTDATGSQSLANAFGFWLESSNNTIGGTTPESGNLISGNGSYAIIASNAHNNQILGNKIGTDATGTQNLGNSLDGIFILGGSSNNTIGGTASGAGNTIAFHNNGFLPSSGVIFRNDAGSGNAILGNSIFANKDLGIDLNNLLATPNDPGDADTGANNLQNFPVLSSATSSSTGTSIQGTFNSSAEATFRLEFFSNPDNSRQGKTFLGFQNVTTDANGNASFTANLGISAAVGSYITATATDPNNNTSEFSGALEIEKIHETDWIRQFGTSENDSSQHLTIDGSGNVYITGYTTGDLAGANAGLWDGIVSKYDNAGNLEWSKQLGTSGIDSFESITTDSSGSLYVTGYTKGSLGGTNAGLYDAFISKYDSDGNLIWLEQFGTNASDRGYGITTDNNGNFYVTGQTNGELGGNNAGNDDIFLAKYDSSGNQQWSQQVGSSNNDQPYDVTTDSNGNIYITGSTEGDLGGTNAGSHDIFVAKYESSGNLAWTKQLGTTEEDRSWDITTDSTGKIYITGHTGGTLAGSNAGTYDAFISKLDSDGTVIWTEQFGTTQSDVSQSIAIDSSDNVYLTGGTRGALEGTNAGSSDIFVRKYDSDGNLKWTEQFGTGGTDSASSITTDSTGQNLYLTGFTYGSLEGTNAGKSDIWIAKLTTDLEPPTISISDRAVDSDPFNAGLQVAPLASVPIRLDASDNVGIGNLELLVDGQVVATSDSDSLEYNVIAPDVLTGTVILKVQGRATDTNGNTALSDERNFVVHRLFTPF
ncbi:MAG: hypothetical protein F6J93_14650, partial [Oscillatoria sp. SIO1A7]|nr:hypothetical protein [Oscillatoria sp. SIO1A7]